MAHPPRIMEFKMFRSSRLLAGTSAGLAIRPRREAQGGRTVRVDSPPPSMLSGLGASQRAVDDGQQNRADDGPQGHEDGISGGVGANHQGGHGCHATGQKRH